jgi:cation diffusion facilitator family transporter
MAGRRHANVTVVAALFTNIIAGLAKIGGFLVTGSAALLAEGVRSAAAATNQTLLLAGSRRARRGATLPHPHGLGRDHYFWSFVVALLATSMGAAFAIVFGALRVRQPDELVRPEVALAILGAAIVLKSLSFGAAIAAAHRLKRQTSWWRFVRRAVQPHIPMVLVQDLGALTGLLLATAAVSASMVTGDPLYDAIGSILVGVVMLLATIAAAVLMKGLLIGESASHDDEEGIAAAIEIEPCVTRIVHMRCQHIGPEELLVGAKVELVDGLELGEVAEVVARVEASVRRAVPAARIMYLEPDVFRTTLPHDLDPPPRAAPIEPIKGESGGLPVAQRS